MNPVGHSFKMVCHLFLDRITVVINESTIKFVFAKEKNDFKKCKK